MSYNLLSGMTSKPKRILVFLGSTPYSSDPLDYDAFIHHIAFGSVFGNLVTQYKLGEHSPELAQSWRVSSDQKEWTFTIRKDLSYSDGSPITGKSFEQSWLRMAKIMKQRKSESGFFENLVGYDQLEQSSTEIEGLSATKENLIIRLIKPMPRLLDKISFGLYSLVHSSQFDLSSTKWLAGKQNLISSGAYQMREWNDNRLLLALRKEYPAGLHHKNPIEEIEIFWKIEAYPVSEIDIAMGSELTTPPSKDFILQGGPPSSIYFMRVISWRDPDSIFLKKENRIVFRNEFYKELKNIGFKPIRSFFPLIIKDIKELSDPPKIQIAVETKKTVRMPNYPQPAFINVLSSKLIEATVKTTEHFNMQNERPAYSFGLLMDEILKQSKKTTWDVVIYGTGILAADPLDDVKFMFRSKEGIFLPDETGEILKELDKNPVNLQRINELLWEQGLIWPVTHYSSGLWARPDLDFSEINLVLPPTSFQWIGWKD